MNATWLWPPRANDPMIPSKPNSKSTYPWRQQPVSCEACRKRKSRCSREQPCTNCQSRGVDCVFLGREPIPSDVRPTPAPNSVASLQAENVAIKARLDKLEDVLLRRDSQSVSTSEERPSKVRRTERLGPPITPPSSASDAETARNYRNDIEDLAGVGSLENARLPQLSTPLNVHVWSVDMILRHISTNPNMRCILLPQKLQMEGFVNAYIEQVDPMQHVIHVPSVRRNLQQLYMRLEEGKQIEPNETVLLLSILATIASYWSPEDSRSSKNSFDSVADATKAGYYWIRTTLDVLEHVKRTATPTLETVQSCLLLIFLIYHMEGFSPKVRAIVAAAISSAKDLRLHKIDSKVNTAAKGLYKDEVSKEICRRVWWHLACTDWLVDFSCT